MTLTVEDMKKWANTKDANYSWSDLYNRIVHNSKQKSGNGDERSHLTTWIDAQQTGRSASSLYNHLNNAALVLWIGEAAGVEERKLKTAYEAARDEWLAKGNAATSAAAVRREIPWSEIAIECKCNVSLANCNE